MAQKPPLSVTIDGGTLTISGTDFPLSPINIGSYDGRPLFCHAQSNGKLLSIVIDDVGPNTLPLGGKQMPVATSAEVTMTLGGTVMANVHVPGIDFKGTHVPALHVKIDATLTRGRIFVDDNPPGRSLGNDAPLTFVLIQESDLGPYRIHWLSTPITIDNADKLSDASLIPPPPPPPGQPAGGVLGPMGFSTP